MSYDKAYQKIRDMKDKRLIEFGYYRSFREDGGGACQQQEGVCAIGALLDKKTAQGMPAKVVRAVWTWGEFGEKEWPLLNQATNELKALGLTREEAEELQHYNDYMAYGMNGVTEAERYERVLKWLEARCGGSR